MNRPRLKAIALRVILVPAFALIGSGAQQDWMRVAARAPGPEARELHSAVYEPGRQRMIVFGGRRNAGSTCAALNDTWILTNPTGASGPSSWTRLIPDGVTPPARQAHSAVYDPAADRMIVFGGNRVDGCFTLARDGTLDDVWVLEHASEREGRATWREVVPVGIRPTSREAHSAVYDSRRNRMVVFGGTTLPGSCAGALNDLWILSNADGTGGVPEWTRVSPRGAAPSARRGQTAVYEASTDRMIVFGGESACRGEVNDLFVLAGAVGVDAEPTWFRGVTAGPKPPERSFHAAVYDPQANRMAILGGRRADVLLDDVWVLTNANGSGDTLAKWEKSASGHVVPSARAGLTGILDAASQRITVFGGSARTSASDAWTLKGGRTSPSNDTWAFRDGLLVDTLPPVILALTASPSRIPYANRRMVPVDVSVAVTDEYDASPKCGIVSVASSVPPLGSGSDALITGSLALQLRSERPRRGVFDERTYTVTVRCTDASAHSAIRTLVIPTLPPEGLEARLARTASIVRESPR